jgi:hypothetical protein
MDHWVWLARTVEGRGGEPLQAMVAKFQSRMLAGDEQVRRLAESGESMGNRAEFDGLRTRSDNERNAVLAQLPPWLRRCGCYRSGAS